jgi:uncharacterized protein (UPF0261 family)
MSSPGKYIIMLGCFDTKAAAFEFLYQCITERGESVITINTGVMTGTVPFQIDFDADQVAIRGGGDIQVLREKRDRGLAMDVMGRGASKIISQLIAAGSVKGVIGMGGGGGTYLALEAMRAVPLGIPKLCLSTLATKDLTRQIGHKDITLMPSVVDVAGLNSILKTLIRQAANAICGMAHTAAVTGLSAKGSIAVSMFGNTTPCVDQCTAILTRLGYEVLAFHANGAGGQAMEALIREGCFEAVLDITTTELADNLCNGICSAGPGRLTAATEIGIPQVVVPGCLDMVNFGHLDTVPVGFQNRQLYSWAPDVTLMRTNIAENAVLGSELASKINPSAAPVTVVLPEKGISQLDSRGGHFYDPQANKVLFDSIRNHSAGNIRVIGCDMHINDATFAEVLVAELLRILR